MQETRMRRYSFDYTELQAEQIRSELPPSSKTALFSEVVRLNVGGKIFETTWKTLKNIPDTRLSRLSKSSRHYDDAKSEFFFDHSSQLFSWILNFYRTGEFHIPREICPCFITAELEFWELNANTIMHCCSRKYGNDLREMAIYCSLESELNRNYSHTVSSSNARGYKIWQFLNNPESSFGAKMWSVTFHILLAISVLLIYLNNDGALRVDLNGETDINSTKSDFKAPYNTTKLYQILHTTPHRALLCLEEIALLFFTFDLITKIAVCPQRKVLLISILTMIDFTYLISTWFYTMIMWHNNRFWMNPTYLQLYVALQIIMTFRVFRIFRAAQKFRGVKTFWLTIKSSMPEISLLLIMMLLASLIFGPVIYCVEILSESQFTSIFKGIYWSIITMTTVGYGDLVPLSKLGYCVSIICAVTGFLLIGMPIPIISSKFLMFYGLRHSQAKIISPVEESIPKRGRQILFRANDFIKFKKRKEDNSTI